MLVLPNKPESIHGSGRGDTQKHAVYIYTKKELLIWEEHLL